MDYDIRQLERNWVQQPDIKTALAMIREQQRSGQQQYIANLQTAFESPCPCTGQDVDGPQPCAYGGGHEDMLRAPRMFSYFFPDLNNVEIASVDSDFDNVTYEVGGDLQQQVDNWMHKFNAAGGHILAEGGPTPLLEDYEVDFWQSLDFSSEDIVAINLISNLDGEDELQNAFLIKEAFVVDMETHQLINRAFHSVVSHYLAPNNIRHRLDRYRQQHSGQGWGSKGAAVFKQLRLVLLGALLSRSAMYRQMAILRITVQGTEVSSNFSG
jgi:hypothetical protein